MNSPLVSIIIPTHNDRDVVCDAIDSSLNQTYNNIEILVIDDGSTDNTEHLLKDAYGNRIRYIKQKNMGLSSARNNGIRSSVGKFIQFLDADDLIDKNKLACQLKQLRSISGKALAYCDYIRSAIGDATVNYARMNPVITSENPLDDFIMKWETEFSIPPHCFLFDAAFFKEYGISFDENLPTHEDWECWMNIFALNPQVVFINMPLADYRVRTNSMCANQLKMRNGYLMAIDKQLRKHSSNSEVVDKLAARKKEIRFLYRDTGPIMRFLRNYPPVFKKLYCEMVPWRVQRMLD